MKGADQSRGQARPQRKTHHLAMDSQGETVPLFHLGGWPDQQPNYSKDSDCWSDHTEGVDTGAALSLITEQQQQELFPSAVLQHSDVTLGTNTAECLPIVGEMKVHVQ